MIVAVAGMHRSGTSMFARYLHRIGINMGEELYHDRTTNPYGHYEDLDFLNLQRRELARAFRGEDYLVTEDFVPSPSFLEGARRLMDRKRGRYGDRHWGWKDPRTTLFLETWKEVCPELRVAALVRSPHRVVNSLCARLRGYFSIRKKERFLKTYTHYNSALLKFIERHAGSVAVLSLERLIFDPEGVLAGLGGVLDYRFDAAVFQALFDAGALSRVRKASLLWNRRSLKAAEAVHARLCDLSL